jgi:AcrR family transcriptional regulator
MAGRPREFDREQALRKARDAFWDRGYEGTSMADLVSALGLASARIYAAFGSKEELFRETVALYEAEEGGFADRALDQEPTAWRAIERMLAEHRRARTASIIGRLRAAVQRGELPESTNVQALGDCFAALLHGLSVQARDGISKERLLALISPAMSLLTQST